MPDMFFDVNVAIAGCPVNLLPLIDDTDFKTIEGAVAYNAAGLALYWHFVTSAGAYTVTAVTPTTAGDYDWTDPGAAGIYTIEIPASGGVSINNNAAGYGWFTGVATGILPWRGPVIGFRAAALNDALMDGGDNLDVNTVQWLGTACATPTVAGVPEVDLTHIAGDAQSGTDLKDFADAGYDPLTNKVQGVVLVDTLTTYTSNTPQTGDSFARIGAPAGASIAADLLAIDNFVDGIEASLAAGVTLSATGLDAIPYTATGAVALAKAVWTDTLTTYTDGMAGKRLKGISAVPDISGTINDAAATTTSFITSLTGYGANFFEDSLCLIEYAADKWQANAVTTYNTTTGGMTFAEAFYAAPTNGLNITLHMTHIHPISQIQSGLATAAALTVVDDFLDTEVAAILAAVDTEVAAIKAKTDSLTFTVAGKVDANMLAVDGDTGSATKLERVLSGNTTGTVGAASTTTSIVTSTLNPAASVTDQFKGLILKFDDATTTAALRGQGTDITASTALGVLTVTALTTAPANGDTFTIS